MKGIPSCQDCPINITIYRFRCEECDLLVAMVKQTVEELGLKNQTKLEVKPWFLWWFKPLLTNLAWHVPILIINGKLISQGVVPDKQTLSKAFLENVIQTTEVNRIGVYCCKCTKKE